MRFLRLFGLSLRLNLLGELQYRVNLYGQVLQSVFTLAAGLAGLAVVFGQTDTLAGWRPAEVLAVLGVYLVLSGLMNSVIRPSMQRVMDDVRDGTFDFVLTKPADAQLLASVRQVEVWKLADLGLGVVVLIVALGRLGATIGLADALAFGLALSAGAAITYSFLLILTTCAFWVVKISNIILIFGDMYEAGRWPVAVYPAWLRTVLTVVVPVAFAVTVPAEALAGRLTGTTLLLAVTLAAVFLGVARWFWRRGIRQYSGASA